MKTWDCEINDVLIIEHKGVEQVARLARYEDQLDDTKPVYVNLRIADGQAWGQRQVKIQPGQIKGVDKDWYKRKEEQWQDSLKKIADAAWAKMSPAEKERVKQTAARLFPRSRTPIEAAIDRACGLE